MATFTKTVFSGGTSPNNANGRGILVAATSSPGTTIHTVTTTTTTLEEIWLYAVNYDTTARKLTVEWGAATSTTPELNDIEQTIPAESGLVLVVPGLILKGQSSASVVRAWAATATSIVVYGYVNQII